MIGKANGNELRGLPDAWQAWQRVAEEAKRGGHEARVRDIAPMRDASVRSIKIRTTKLAKFLNGLAQ